MASLFSRRRDAPTPNVDETNSTNASPNKWLGGLVSGAGKLISSVFGSGSDDEFEEDDVPNVLTDDEMDVADESQRNLLESNQAPIEEQRVISPSSQSKAVIQQLLTQETFSREESDKLIKIIQSRVVVVEPSSPFQIGEQTPSSPVVPSQEIYSEAISEAKKWLMEKKQSNSKPRDLGPCTLNTDLTQFGMESDIGSPVDVAKSYMQSKPPWSSPFLTNYNNNYNNNSTVFKAPISPIGARKFNDDIMLGSSSSSKGLKRDYLSTGLWDPLEDSSRRIRSTLIQTDSSSKLFGENEGPTFENDGLVKDGINEKIVKENAEVVILETAVPVIGSERNDEETMKEPPNLVSEPRPSEGDVNMTNSLHESTNKNTNGTAEKPNMESEFESSNNGGLTSSTGTETGTKNLNSEVVPVRKGRKRVVSGRGRGRGRAAK